MIELAALKVGFFLAMTILCVFDIIRNYEKSSSWERFIGLVFLTLGFFLFFLNLPEYIKLI